VSTDASSAEEIWAGNPHLALAHADLGAFRQAWELRRREHTHALSASGRSWASLWDAWQSDAESRRRLVRAPGREESHPLPVCERIGARLTVWLYGPIGGPGVRSAEVREALDANRDVSAIVLRIASAGGVALESTAIARCLMHHGARVVGVIDRFAYSGASVIAAVSDQLFIRRNATWMAHRAHKVVIGNADDLRRGAAELNHDDMEASRLYSRKRGNCHEIRQLVAEERFLCATEAVALGVCDAVIPDLPFLAQGS
jgi:ATP-dependent protease ClpP protease subunit